MKRSEELRYLILGIQREGNRILADELRPLGLTPSQAEVLTVLARHQPLSLSGLGELLVCETGNNPSRLVDRLVRAGLVDREPEPGDRRQVNLTLTPAGRRLTRKVAAAEARLHQILDRMLDGQPTDGAIAVLRALARQLPVGHALEARRR